MLPPRRSAFSLKVLMTLYSTRLTSTSLSLSVALVPSNIDICSTFSIWKRRRLVSSEITDEICWSIDGDLRTLWSLSICAARDMDDTGVLNSWVILLIKSFFISESFFWRKAVMMVKTNISSSISVSANVGTIKAMDEYT